MSPSAVSTANPLLEGLRLKRTPEPCILTIFGASGDLTARKLFPALYALANRRLLPDGFAVVGSARSPMSDDEFRAAMREAVDEHGRDELRDDIWDWLAERTGVPAITLPFTVGGDDKAKDLFGLFDSTIDKLLAVAK